MTNITKTLNSFIVEQLPTLSIYNDSFPDETSESLISRHDPSTAQEREFIDGSVSGSLAVSYYMRSSKPKTIRETLSKIISMLNGVHLHDNEDNLDIDVEVVTLPQFVSEDEKKMTIYTFSVNCIYELN